MVESDSSSNEEPVQLDNALNETQEIEDLENMSSSDSESETSDVYTSEFNEYISSDTESDNEIIPQNDDTTEINSKNSLLLKLLWFIFFWQSVFHISEAAVKSILYFLRYFVRTLGLVYQNALMVSFSQEIPLTVKTAEKYLGIDLDHSGIVEYVVCPKCSSVYCYDNCVEIKSDGTKHAKQCHHIKYPHHPYLSKRQPCNAELLKLVQQGKSLIPIKTYCYYPLHLSIQRLVLQPGFLNMCEEWRMREHVIPTDYLGDTYDGNIWKLFRTDFLSLPYSYLLCLNVDWFQPFKHTQYSVGAIYATIQNLPRRERFKQGNVVLIGIIPGPKEPALSIDSYLQPLVKELNEYYTEGFLALTPFNTHIRIRLALSCVSCDIPATRKVCGFLSHHAKLGCNKCYKDFISDSALFDRSNWKLRTAMEHREECRKINLEVTKTKLRAAESQYGVRFCALLRLSYYDPIKFVAVDLMHNLLLGTSKHMFCTWIDLGLLSNNDLNKLDSLINEFVIPNNTGRLPTHIKSNYLNFKAAQWSSWTIIYSPVLLKDILPIEHYKCWLLFVRATAILSQRIIRTQDVETADMLLEKFCKTVETLCGRSYCTINMHMHLHIKDTLLNFGPAHATWCFSFERYNHLLESVHTNNKSVEGQFMRRFLKTQMIHSLSINVADQDLLQLTPKDDKENMPTPLSQFTTSDSDLISVLKLSQATMDVHCNYRDNYFIKLMEPTREAVFTEKETSCLTALYQQLNTLDKLEYVSPFYTYSGRVSLGGDILGSTLNNRSAVSSSVISAYWPTHGSIITAYNSDHSNIGKVMFYFNHPVTILNHRTGSSEIIRYTMACVQWMNNHQYALHYGISAVVCCNSFCERSLCSYIPVLRIAAKCANCLTTIDNEKVFVACPIPLKFCM